MVPQLDVATANNISTDTATKLRVLAYVHLRNIDRSTGAGRVARQLIEHLNKREDVDIHILADKADHLRIVSQVGRPWTSYRYHLFNSDTSSQQARWLFLGSPRAEDYWSRAQIIYCTAESYVPRHTARLAVTLHDVAYLEPDAHRHDWAFYKQRMKWMYLYRVLGKKADLFQTVSLFSAERITHYMPQLRDRIKVVYNAVTPRFFAPVSTEGAAFVRRSGLMNRPYVLLPGGLHYRKNADLILVAWPRLRALYRDVQLVVVNHSDPEYVTRAKALDDSVRLLGFVDDESLHALYSSASAVWFPSRYEGFGLPVVEAMACGTPVVASNASALPEVSGGAALLVSATDPDQHVAALDGVLSSGPLQSHMKQLGKQRASQFTWDKSAQQLRSCFAELL